jgi:hypothetical protein
LPQVLYEGINVSGAEVRAPKSARKGHPHAFRLAVDHVVHTRWSSKMVQQKFVISVDSEAALSRWNGVIQAGKGKFAALAGVSPSAVDHRSQYKCARKQL